MVRPIEEKGFRRLGRLVEYMERCGKSLTGASVAKLASPGETRSCGDWTVDSAWTFEEQNPTRGRRLIYVIAITFLALLAWAALAPLDEVVSGTGKAVAQSGTQAVQSVDGGLVEAILVKEADRVEKGAVLIRVDPVRFDSMLGQQQAKVLSLQAKAARLQALSSGSPFSPPENLRSAIPEIVENERKLYQTNLQELSSRTDIIREQIRQKRQELVEANARYSHASQSRSLAEQELNMTRPLLESGAIPKVEVMRLERALAQAKSDRSQAAAQISRIKASIQEGEGQLRELDFRTKSLWRNELNATLGELESLSEGNKALSLLRSEERRVGKECRSRWSPYH